MLFLCQATPYLRIYNPDTESFAEFKGGKLELEEGDDDYEVVKAEALRNPSITMLTEATQCGFCGEPFVGKAAAAQLGKHKKEAHFDQWVAEKQHDAEKVVNKEVKGSQPFACDLCLNIAPFRNESDYAAHIKAIHIATDVDDEGNVKNGGSSVTPAEPTAAMVR